MSEDDKLFIVVTQYLDITWELDDADKKKIIGIINRGKSYIDGIAGEKLEYTEETLQKALLLDYVRYVRSNALDEFQTNYKKELIALQIAKEVERFVKETASNI